MFLKWWARGILQGKGNRAVDMLFPNERSFIDSVTGYIKSSKIAREHETYRSLMSTAVSGDWKLG